MSPYFESYLTVGAFAVLGAVLVMVMLGVASVLRPAKPSKTKQLTYECGVDPVGEGWSQTYVRYYVFGLLFIIFGVEAVYIFPWAIQVEAVGVFGLVARLELVLARGETLVLPSEHVHVPTGDAIRDHAALGERERCRGHGLDPGRSRKIEYGGTHFDARR